MWRICTLLAVSALCAAQPVEPKLPVLNDVPSELNFRVPNKEDLVLSCATIDNNGEVKYSWIKDGKPLSLRGDVKQMDNEGTLIFKTPVDSDAGQYLCLAQTKFGVASSRTINVKKVFIEKPKIEVKKHKPVDGKTFELDCNIPNSYPKPVISWVIKSASESKSVSGARFTVSPQGTLYFASVEKDDVGADRKYVCLGTTPASDEPVTLAEHVLEGLEEDQGPKDHEVVKQYVSNEVTAKVGESTFLYCIYGGDPLAHPDWFKDGKNVNNGPKDRVTRHNKSVGKRLLIKDVWESDDGEYTCVVDNEIGKKQQSSMKLKVVRAPEFLIKPENKMVVKEGEDVSITCQVSGKPMPKVTWTYNNEPLPKSAVKEEKKENVSINVSDVTLRNVKKENTGYYGCRAENEFGENYTETLLYVM